MTTQTEAERLADELQEYVLPCAGSEHWDTLDAAAAELRRLVSFNQQLMDEVARLNKALADEREACALVVDKMLTDSAIGNHPRTEALFFAARNIRARGNT